MNTKMMECNQSVSFDRKHWILAVDSFIFYYIKLHMRRCLVYSMVCLRECSSKVNAFSFTWNFNPSPSPHTHTNTQRSGGGEDHASTYLPPYPGEKGSPKHG